MAAESLLSVRRLEDKDVRDVFECLHLGMPPPPHLPFRIVPVGPNGLKLSPPSHEFPDGLFVLLRPRSKGKKGQNNAPQPPPHLKHLVVRDGEISMDTCPWSLSGPQFPQPTAIQQRYCYPKGRPEYSGRKGGALWTMYRKDGKEDMSFRLLHVYYSAKRAVNSGEREGGHGDEWTPPAISSPAKRGKKADQFPSPKPREPTFRSHGFSSPPPPPSHPLKSPATTSTAYPSPPSETSLDSPLSHFEGRWGFSNKAPSGSRPIFSEPYSRNHQHRFQQPRWTTRANFVSPCLTANKPNDFHHPAMATIPGASFDGDEYDEGTMHATLAPSLGMHPRYGYGPGFAYRDRRDDDAMSSRSASMEMDPFSYGMAAMEDGSMAAASDAVDWNEDSSDPLRLNTGGVLLMPSQDETYDAHSRSPLPSKMTYEEHVWTTPEDNRIAGASSTTHGMARELDYVHGSLRDAILAAPGGPQRSALVNVLVHWARDVATDPLAPPGMSLRVAVPNWCPVDTTFDRYLHRDPVYYDCDAAFAAV